MPERKYVQYWPILVYGMMLPLNTDAIITIGAIFFRIPKEVMWPVVPPLATAELCYSFWFWGWWVLPQVGQLEKIREARKQLKKRGLLDRWVLDGLLSVYYDVVSPENGTRRRIKRWGSVAIWLAGLNPFPWLPTRGACGIVLGALRLKSGFWHLLAANLIHVIGMIYVWDWLLGR